MNKVFLDANILYANTTRSLFVWLHTNEVIAAYWSYDVWEEAFEAFRRHHPDRHEQIRKSLTERLIGAYPECLVQTPKSQPLGLKDPKDEHVLASASVCCADYVLTNDEILINDPQAVGSWSLMTADQFLVTVAVAHSPLSVVQSVHDHITQLPQSRPTIDRYVASLRKSQLVEFADWIEARRKLGKLFDDVWS